MRTRGISIAWACLVLIAVACGGGGSGQPDADPNRPDADPNAPDADPDAPDAQPDPTCQDGLMRCGGQCVDLRSDDDHCSRCDARCDAGASCVLGTCVPGVGALVLSEIHAREPAYFELYNGGATAIELAGYRVQWSTDGGGSGSVDLPAYSLAPQQFVVLREGAGAIGEGVIYLADSIGWVDWIAVRLLAPGGLGIDFVRTGAATVPPPTGTAWTGPNAANPSATIDQSLVRNVYAPDTDSAADWSLVGSGSPGAYCPRPGRCGDACFDFATDRNQCGECGVACGASQICLDGICRTGFVGLWISEYRRWPRPGIEVHNPTATPVVMTDYRLDITGPVNFSYVFPAGFTLQPGAYAFVFMGPGTDDAVSLFAGSSGAFGPNVALTLYDSAVTPLDHVRFGTIATPVPAGANWFGPSVAPPDASSNTSARRDVEDFDTDSANDWVHGSPATPGFACHGGLSLCGGVCVALAEDPANCGACGAACGPHQTCAQGTCASVGAVVLAEIRNVGAEAIELFNGTAATVDLGGWTVEWAGDQVGTYTIAPGVLLGPGQFLYLIEGSGGSTSNVIFMGQEISWTSYVAVSLRDGSGAGVDFVRTGTSNVMPPQGTSWSGPNAPNPSNSVSESLVRQVYAPDTDGAADWRIVAGSTPARLCAVSESVCAGRCTDLSRDAGACGACGNTCGHGGVCHQGRCVEDGALRLAVASGTDGVSSGRLEVFRAGAWTGIYYGNFGSQQGNVACRQLGLGQTTLTTSTTSSLAPYIYNVTCAGSEPRLLDCSHLFYNGVYGSALRLACAP
jgi:hypothetical protein